MSDTASANPALSCSPLNYVLVMQYNPDFTVISPTVAEKKHSRFLESLFKSPEYNFFWHQGIGFTGMHVFYGYRSVFCNSSCMFHKEV